MAELTAKQKSFIELMVKSEEHARRGFELLLGRPGFEKFFDSLKIAGLFKPDHNPVPVPSDEAGFFRIPYWSALDYLKAVAKLSGERCDLDIAEKVMAVVRTVSMAREHDGSIRDNYHTHRIFAEILGLVPTSVVSRDDLKLIPVWLDGKFERGMVAHALDTGAMTQFLKSEEAVDWEKAADILCHCTAVRWVPKPGYDGMEEEPKTVVEDYWLKQLINNHSGMLGIKIGKPTAEIFLKRIREVYGKGNRDKYSYLHRPAIEEHKQNHDWAGPDNRFIEGLRDVLLSWIGADVIAARPFVAALLHDETEIVRRIGIYALAQRWEALRDIYVSVLGPQLFAAGHLHELYGLLKTRFDSMEEGEKEQTIEAIRQIPLPEGDESEQLLKHEQRRWLCAFAGKGYGPADVWYRELQSNKEMGPPPDHPDFHSYMETFWGPGPTPYQVQELLAFAEEGTIIEKLNSFRQLNDWRGPSTKALIDTLEGAIGLAPDTFLRLLPEFLHAKRPYQYGVISGFKRLWESPKEKQTPTDWDRAWDLLANHLEVLIGDPRFWTEECVQQSDLTPTRDWIPPVIADLLKAGARDDARAYPASLHSRMWALIGILLEKADVEDNPNDDAMTQAINSTKGKAIEALFNHSLRVCRLSDKAFNSHAEEWTRMEPAFEKEITKCKNANFEFSTLAGAYIANLDYMNSDWLRTHVGLIFPTESQANFVCAVGGLAYAPVNRSIYVLLVEGGVLDWALRQELRGRHTREKLIERIAIAYLWEIEELDAPRFAYIFESGLVDDLVDASTLFWSISHQGLSDNMVERILKFWGRCVEWSRTTAISPAKLLSSLSRLSCYLKYVGGREKEWLLAVAPHANYDHNADNFIEELDRLADQSVAEVSAVFGKVLETYSPSWDFEDRMKSLLTKFAKHGQRTDALAYAEQLRHLPGMLQFFSKLSSQ